MAKITTSNLDSTINTKLAAGESANAAVANIVSLAISSVQIADSSYNVIDDTAANTGGGYLVINGTGFTNQSVVIVGTTNATSTTFANTKQLRAQVPGLAAASYPLYVVDSVTGATAIKVNGLTYSSFPAWSTASSLSNQSSNASFSVSLSANSDSSITYANTTALPTGTTLAANGYFSGTVSIGAQTTYSFDVKATDAENQDVSRTFSLTVTVIPQTKLYLWGANGDGQLGLNDTVYKSSPVQVGTGTNWSKVSTQQGYGTARFMTMATKTDGTLWLWGNNVYGALGLNDTANRSSPVQIGATTNWSEISAGRTNAAAIKTTGTLWAWGRNEYGQLGQNDRVYRSSPTQVGTGTDWSKVAFSTQGFIIALKTDGTLWSWGVNDFGVIAQNNTVARSSPTQVGTDTNWSKISAGHRGCLATKTTGTLWAWGRNYEGWFGTNNIAYKSSPVQVGTDTNWNLISITYGTAIATKTTGTLWTWGYNDGGALGQNDRVWRSSPTQVGADTNWDKVSASNRGGLVTKTTGTLWSFGYGSSGVSGQNDTVARSSPVQIGAATNWSVVSYGGNMAAAISST